MYLLAAVRWLVLLRLSDGLSNSFGKNDILTNSNDDGMTRFFIIGDWGGSSNPPYVTASQIAVAKAMGTLGQELNTRFQISVGDNFYFDGVQAVTDPRFKFTFENVFESRSLQTPWYVIGGNHDHNGKVSAQIEYGRVSKRWIYPDYFYSFTLREHGTLRPLADFIMLDTVLLCDKNDLSGFELRFLYKSTVDSPLESVWRWIERRLRQSIAPYLIVVGHYPVYSVGGHGPTKCLVDRLLPLLQKYRVTAYLCGHDHSLQHLLTHSTNGKINYFVIGNANFADPNQIHFEDVPTNSLKYFWAGSESSSGFGLVEMNSTIFNFSFYDASKRKLYQTTLKPRFN